MCAPSTACTKAILPSFLIRRMSATECASSVLSAVGLVHARKCPSFPECAASTSLTPTCSRPVKSETLRRESKTVIEKLPLHQMVRGPRNSPPPFWSILKSEREEKGLKKLPREIVPPAVTLEEKRLQRRMNVHIGQRRVAMKPANGFVHDLTPF